MRSLRSLIDRSGRSLTFHVDRLQSKLDELRERLREAASRLLGETMGDVVQQVVHGLLAAPGHDPIPAYQPRDYPEYEPREYEPGDYPSDIPSWRQSAASERYCEPSSAYRRDDPEDFPPAPPEPEPELETPRVSRWRRALAVGLRAASWWMQRRTGRSSLAAALGIGATATAVMLAGGPLTWAGAGLAVSALSLAGLGSMLSSGLATVMPVFT
jgi:hypothetical protein